MRDTRFIIDKDGNINDTVVDLNERLQEELNDDCRFILSQDDFGNYEIRYDDDKVFHFLWEICPFLNEQQAIINKLSKTLADMLGERLKEHTSRVYFRNNGESDNDE